MKQCQVKGEMRNTNWIPLARNTSDGPSVDFSSIVRHSPSHGQWENAGPLSWMRVDLVGGKIDLDMVQMDLIEEDQVVLVRD